jgi:hypothetical protein|tara:strand:+ start:998 stop:1339 length:342 start_codon:yes stop_codon:yes gene_type:complete
MTVTKVNGLMMKAEEIDDEGNWEQDGRKMSLLGAHLPVPSGIRYEMDPDRQEVIMTVKAKDFLDECPDSNCGSKDVGDGVILVTPWAKLFPAKCCDQMIWMVDERGEMNEQYA